MSPADSKTLSLLGWSIWTTALLAAILSAAIVWLVEREHIEQDWVRRSRAIDEKISHFLVVAQRMESNQRGYLFTGRDLYLSNYNDAEKALPPLIDEMFGLHDGDQRHEKRLADLRQVVIEKIRELRSTIDEQKAGRPDAARAIVNSDRGFEMMNQIQQIISEIRDEEHQTLSSRQLALQRVGTLLQVGAPIPLLLIAAIGILTHQFIRRSLSTLTVAVQQREQNRVRLQLAMDAAHLGSWQYDPLHRVVSGDMRFKEIVDVAENEAPLKEIMERANPNDMGRVWAAFNAVHDPAETERSMTEFRLQGDGKVRWVETLGLAHFQGKRASAVGVVADITQRKEHEERELLLMREMNHRAKNMLGLVQAIARQTATRNPEDFMERFSERIQALAANQELLVHNEWKSVDLGSLARAQLAHFADLIGSRIAIQGPTRRLKAAAAQGIGMALHELATNAGKYGALSTGSGRVDICWGTDGDTFTMDWVERDGPQVSAPARRGFGTLVMEAMTERSVDGTVNLEYAPSGVTWRLTCPAANVLGSNGEPVMRSEMVSETSGTTSRSQTS